MPLKGEQGLSAPEIEGNNWSIEGFPKEGKGMATATFDRLLNAEEVLHYLTVF